MQGKIIKGIAGFYYVHVVNKGIYECKAKGAFRNQKIKPLVGDNVVIDILDEDNKKGNIVELLERNNKLIRPAVANIDQAMLIFALDNPAPSLNLLDKFLILMERQNVKTVICFNKCDLVENHEIDEIKDLYIKSGYEVIVTSTFEEKNIDSLLEKIKGKTTAFAGPSGVGKSSILNMILPEANSETGAVSEKIGRGRHTTRHTEIFNIVDNTYIMDTPGFSSLDINEIEKDELKDYYPDFEQFNGMCRFVGCVHINEPNCIVKEEVEKGNISQSRYDNYVIFFNELKNIKRY